MADKRAGKAGEKEEKMQEEAKERSIDDIYRYDEEAIAAQRKNKPWENESAHCAAAARQYAHRAHCVMSLTCCAPPSACSPLSVKYFKTCRVSALAAMKMVRPPLTPLTTNAPSSARALIPRSSLLSCLQLKHALAGVEKGRKAGTAPVEIMGLMIGKAEGESIVVLDACPIPVEGSETRVVADDAQVHMLQLMDSMELRRKEGFVGWYHRSGRRLNRAISGQLLPCRRQSLTRPCLLALL